MKKLKKMEDMGQNGGARATRRNDCFLHKNNDNSNSCRIMADTLSAVLNSLLFPLSDDTPYFPELVLFRSSLVIETLQATVYRIQASPKQETSYQGTYCKTPQNKPSISFH
jgi:hypothetical protein